MSNANKALAVLAALAFFLPFVSVSCSTSGIPGMPGNAAIPKISLEIKGAKLVQCYLSPCSPKDIFSSSQLGPLAGYVSDRDLPDSAKIGGTGGKDVGLNFVLFSAIAVVVAIIVLFFGRGGELLSGLASVGAIVLLFMFRSKFGDAFAPELNSPEMKAAGSMMQFQLQFGIGFWACAVLSGLSGILAFKGALTGRAPVPAGAPGLTGGYAPPPQTGATPHSEQLAVCPS
ncbi:MAG TPA: hypothetical protein VI685_00075, partial [Candidatus Angelobacter sp.]